MCTPSWTVRRFVKDVAELDEVLLNIKLGACPHCRVTGALVGHGFLRGYAEACSEIVVRGRRIFCSNRGLRPGCGRTFPVALSTVLLGFVVRTVTLFAFARAVLAGLTRRAAWLRTAAGALSLSSGYRLWGRIERAQSALRVRLHLEISAPACASSEPLAALFAHLVAVFGAAESSDWFARFQVHTQRGLLGTS